MRRSICLLGVQVAAEGEGWLRYKDKNVLKRHRMIRWQVLVIGGDIDQGASGV